MKPERMRADSIGGPRVCDPQQPPMTGSLDCAHTRRSVQSCCGSRTCGPEKPPAERRALLGRGDGRKTLPSNAWPSKFLLLAAALFLTWSLAAAPFIPGLSHEARLSPSQTGQVLLSELNCAACHEIGPEVGAVARKGAPDLTNLTARLRADRLPQLVANPHAAKPGTTMPDLFSGMTDMERREAGEAIAHVLLTWSPNGNSSQPVDAQAAERGHDLFHSVGCVACHGPEDDASDSVPLGALEKKYHLQGLTAFLEDPLAARPGARMPDLKLDHWEAADIASYLLRKQLPPAGNTPAFKTDKTLADKGHALLRKHRCLNCHQPDTGEARLPLKSDRLDRGCLSGSSGAWPDYALSVDQRTALKAALHPGGGELNHRERVAVDMARLNCLACHKRDGVGGPSAARDRFFTTLDPNLGEQGRIPPDLTQVGSKLKAPWLHKVIAQGAAARPYLKTRMPQFGEIVGEALASAIKRSDRTPPVAITRNKDPRESQKHGLELAGTRGLSCVACHPFRGQSSSAIQATDLGLMYERLEEHWFHRYMANPQAVSPLTIMPSFWPGGRSPLPGILGGDPSLQRDALWQYLARGPEARRPAGIQLEPLELAVGNEAVMLRRSYPDIGKRGIGVGYPNGVNLSFDAGQVRLASIWQGGFIEASGVWRGQGHGRVRVLGENTVKFPEGPAFAILESEDDAWPAPDGKRSAGFQFGGYTLDEQRRPKFEYEFGPIKIRDLFLDLKDDRGRSFFRRKLSWNATAEEKGLHFRVVVDPEISETGDGDYAIGRSLLIKTEREGVLRSTDKGKELLLPLDNASATVIEYHWKQ